MRYKIQQAKEIPTDAQGRHPIIVLERISPLGIQPEYCIHGRVQCYRCQHWCWLGDKSHDQVLNGVHPICMECAMEITAERPEFDWEASRVENVDDHRRADGPH